jgi:hypothetical protein
MVALHDDRTWYLALVRPLRGRADVDEHRTLAQLAECLVRRQPAQPPARGGQDLVHGPGARRPACHHPATSTVSRLTSPPGVRS